MMKAMILAAGFGERMRPLTDTTPKPLLCVADTPLIAWHLRALSAAGIAEVVINVSHLAEQVIDYCGDGGRWGLQIRYSREETPLETAGGIIRALPMLGCDPFLVVNGDVWTDFDLQQLVGVTLRDRELAQLVLVDNPPHHPLGDFVLSGSGWVGVRRGDQVGVTYAGVGLYSAEMFDALPQGKLALRPLLDAAIAARRLGGIHHAGRWEDVGTPERLRELDSALR